MDGLGDACDDCPNDALNDEDMDGVCGDVDICVASEPDDPIFGLRRSFYAQTDGDGPFETSLSPFRPSQRLPRVFTQADTGGCSCEQIANRLRIGAQAARYGCSEATLDRWLLLVSLGIAP